MTRVLAFGTFDIFHPGHEHYLKEARKYGDELVVVVARDETVREVKGKLPHNNERYRACVLEALPYVDHVVLGLPGDKYRIVEEIRPDVIVLGYDQTAFVDKLGEKLASRGLHPKIVRLTTALEPEKYKSSKMRP